MSIASQSSKGMQEHTHRLFVLDLRIATLNRTSQSKVRKLQHALVVDQQIRSYNVRREQTPNHQSLDTFNIAVQNIGTMQKQQAFQQLLHVALEVINAELFLEALGVQQASQIVLHILEHKIDRVQIIRV